MIKIEINLPYGYNSSDLRDRICEKIPVTKSELSEIRILRRTLEVNKNGEFGYKTSVGISLGEEREAGLLKMKKKVSPAPQLAYTPKKSELKSRPVVVGSGPAGLFAALTLAEAGANPLILERGLPVEQRAEKVKLFSALGILDPECNIQFGEGGAGTYSDGKLKVGSLDRYKYKVLSEFCKAGASEEIMYSSTAHLGTDKLSDIIRNIRGKIISLGGEFIFSAKLTGINSKSGKVCSLEYEKDREKCELEAENVILATGHSAEDVFVMLQKSGVEMSAKGFGIGVRIEHPREYINRLVYGKYAPPDIESASYHLVTHLKNGRSVYSFCMCPGGTVVPATSQKGCVVTNGMSENSRMDDNSNAALLVSLSPADFPDNSPLSGIYLQRNIERGVFELSNSYKAPVCTLSDFAEKREAGKIKSVVPSYPVGTFEASPDIYLPKYISESLRAAISDFDEWMGGFYYPDAVLTGAETRSTSPVRVVRGENYQTPEISGLYPAGEGAGYSGGIVSSAVDGIKCAEAMLS